MNELLESYDIYSVKYEFLDFIVNELDFDYFSKLLVILEQEYINYEVYPCKADVFNAFKYKDFNDIKVIIIGQDPYHGKNQANGLSFSVNSSVMIPPSLRNIFKELHSDIGLEMPCYGDLTKWANEGVLLLNSVLTVRQGCPNSHKNLGWVNFTDRIIKKLSDERENLVFILWGNISISKQVLIDSNKHLIIKSSHPSGFSAHKGFFSSKPFSKTNKYLKERGILEVNWKL